MDIKLEPKERKLYRDAIDVYGFDNQLDQYAEECLEGALAARKYLRAIKSASSTRIHEARKALISEIVDTLNMSIQMTLVLGGEDFVNEWEFKINRQIQRVKDKTTESYEKGTTTA